MSVPSLNIESIYKKIGEDTENVVVNCMRVIFGTLSTFACSDKGKLCLVSLLKPRSVCLVQVSPVQHCHDKVVKFGYGQQSKLQSL